MVATCFASLNIQNSLNFIRTMYLSVLNNSLNKQQLFYPEGPII